MTHSYESYYDFILRKYKEMDKENDLYHEQGIIPVEDDIMPEHGGPQDRGSADYYYGRAFDPHWYPEGTGFGVRVEKNQMTENEIAQYTYGYENETDEKEW